jgi:hypothetical protein
MAIAFRIANELQLQNYYLLLWGMPVSWMWAWEDLQKSYSLKLTIAGWLGG